MNKTFSDLVSFMAKCFIAGFSFYLVASALFYQDLKKLNGLLEQGQANIKRQEQLINLDQSEMLYQQALLDENKGDLKAAAQKMIVSAKLAELNMAKYATKLNELMARGALQK